MYYVPGKIFHRNSFASFFQKIMIRTVKGSKNVLGITLETKQILYSGNFSSFYSNTIYMFIVIIIFSSKYFSIFHYFCGNFRIWTFSLLNYFSWTLYFILFVIFFIFSTKFPLSPFLLIII